MSLHRTLSLKYGGKPGLLLVAAVGFTLSFYGFYRYSYKPWHRRRRLNEAEEYANFVFQKENERRV